MMVKCHSAFLIIYLLFVCVVSFFRAIKVGWASITNFCSLSLYCDHFCPIMVKIHSFGQSYSHLQSSYLIDYPFFYRYQNYKSQRAREFAKQVHLCPSSKFYLEVADVNFQFLLITITPTDC